jgi:hypothetical protein
MINNDARAWVKRQQGPDEVISIRLDEKCEEAAVVFQLYTAYEAVPITSAAFCLTHSNTGSMKGKH